MLPSNLLYRRSDLVLHFFTIAQDETIIGASSWVAALLGAVAILTIRDGRGAGSCPSTSQLGGKV